MVRLLPFQSVSRPEPQNGSQVLGITDSTANTVIEALGSETTREILAAVYTDPAPASEIAERTDTSLQNATYHLEKLQAADLVEIPETWYSAQGKEMNVYAPTNESVVLIAGDAEITSSIRDRLRHFLGGIGLVVAGSILIELVVRYRAGSEEVFHRHPTEPTTTIVSHFGGISPGLSFFLGGSLILLLAFIRALRSADR